MDKHQFNEKPQDRQQYWERQLIAAEKAVEYAKRQLAKIAIKETND